MERMEGFRDAGALLRFLETTRNDLEAPARALGPAISDVLEAISAQEGTLLARMSGSGATCFGLFASDEQAKRAAEAVSAAQPGWWVCATSIAQ